MSEAERACERITERAARLAAMTNAELRSRVALGDWYEAQGELDRRKAEMTARAADAYGPPRRAKGMFN